ncbi:flagellar hook-associated protein FlgK [Sporosarcina sp. P37]|uniref:flagellar hook-associated protein FlgK n=1 Tax=unclassified Sporosarcina TaxID=2647733 RepID=UPI000A17E916|nr:MULTISPECIES: flagellar hook-associated protein FlgK [unclassified Sporosarcina]ARK25511.1 flagellar hook-associated protein FlgK [Sporosarcina sp. P37]PID17959.1 flagellar hook-associated protein FlgK [Sporosarcina sp. P35]
MRSTFMGLETSKRGLYTQQSALYTTGHNIGNANTPGYSRQRVNMQATSGFPGVGLNAGTVPGFLGTGVEAGSIQRIRDTFVDHQYRSEANKLGYWESQTKAIAQMEDAIGEPSEYGLQQSLTDFWQSLQTLATSPENGGARAVVVERGVAVADSFNYISKSIAEIKTNLGDEINVSAVNINSILGQITELNRQIADVEPNGYLPNDLYDARDGLLDQLSTYLPIEVSYEKTGGRAPAIAEGTVTIKVMTNDKPITVLQKNTFSNISINGKNETTGEMPKEITGFTFNGAPAGGADLSVADMKKSGELKSLVESYGYKETADGPVKGMYPDMLAKLDKMATAFATEFNKIHQGDPANGVYATDLDGKPGEEFFKVIDGTKPISASNIKVNENIISNPNKVAASTSKPVDSTDPTTNPEVGNGQNAQNLGNALFNKLEALGGSSVQGYFAQAIGQLGVAGQQAVKMAENSGTLLLSVSNRRDSISSVSLDEEMTDMIRFQQAYNASARMITVMDEALDKIINGMGTVGR